MNKTQIAKIRKAHAKKLAETLSVGNGYSAVAARMAAFGEEIGKDVSGDMEEAQALYKDMSSEDAVKYGEAKQWAENGRRSTRWFQAATLAQHFPNLMEQIKKARDAALTDTLTKKLMPTSPLIELAMKNIYNVLKDENKTRADWFAATSSAPEDVVETRAKKQLGMVDRKTNHAAGDWALAAAQAMSKLFHGTKGDAGQPGVSFDDAETHKALATAQKLLLAVAISDGVLDSTEDAKKIKSLSVKALPDDDTEISLKAILDVQVGDFRCGVKQAEPKPEKPEPVTQAAGFELPDGFDLDVFTQLPGAAQATLMSAWAKKASAQ